MWFAFGLYVQETYIELVCDDDDDDDLVEGLVVHPPPCFFAASRSSLKGEMWVSCRGRDIRMCG